MSVTISTESGKPTTFRIDVNQWLPQPPQDVFPFFADAHNLEQITPPFLRFHVVTPRPIEMRAGALIDYRLRIRMVPVRWRTRIAAWEPSRMFVDEQLRGPYQLWHHTHTFEPERGGSRCVDVVRYRMFGGRLVDWLLVRRDLQKIFEFRRDALARIFSGELASRAASCG